MFLTLYTLDFWILIFIRQTIYIFYWEFLIFSPRHTFVFLLLIIPFYSIIHNCIIHVYPLLYMFFVKTIMMPSTCLSSVVWLPDAKHTSNLKGALLFRITINLAKVIRRKDWGQAALLLLRVQRSSPQSYLMKPNTCKSKSNIKEHSTVSRCLCI